MLQLCQQAACSGAWEAHTVFPSMAVGVGRGVPKPRLASASWRSRGSSAVGATPAAVCNPLGVHLAPCDGCHQVSGACDAFSSSSNSSGGRSRAGMRRSSSSSLCQFQSQQPFTSMPQPLWLQTCVNISDDGEVAVAGRQPSLPPHPSNSSQPWQPQLALPLSSGCQPSSTGTVHPAVTCAPSAAAAWVAAPTADPDPGAVAAAQQLHHLATQRQNLGCGCNSHLTGNYPYLLISNKHNPF
jgi:hypothetical protein